MAELQRIIVDTDKAPKPIVPAYSQAIRVKASEFVYIAGQVSVDLDGNIIGEGDIEAQVNQVFKNLGGVLEGVGATFQNVMEFTSYIVGRETFEGYARARAAIYEDIYPNGDMPPNTLLVISGLARPEFLVEIKAVAALA